MEGLEGNVIIKLEFRGEEKTISSYNELKPYLELICSNVKVVCYDKGSE